MRAEGSDVVPCWESGGRVQVALGHPADAARPREGSGRGAEPARSRHPGGPLGPAGLRTVGHLPYSRVPTCHVRDTFTWNPSPYQDTCNTHQRPFLCVPPGQPHSLPVPNSLQDSPQAVETRGYPIYPMRAATIRVRRPLTPDTCACGCAPAGIGLPLEGADCPPGRRCVPALSQTPLLRFSSISPSKVTSRFQPSRPRLLSLLERFQPRIRARDPPAPLLVAGPKPRLGSEYGLSILLPSHSPGLELTLNPHHKRLSDGTLKW